MKEHTIFQMIKEILTPKSKKTNYNQSMRGSLELFQANIQRVIYPI